MPAMPLSHKWNAAFRSYRKVNDLRYVMPWTCCSSCKTLPSAKLSNRGQELSPPFQHMAKPKPSPPEETLELLLDRVSNAREELVAIERTLERLRSDIAKAQT